MKGCRKLGSERFRSASQWLLKIAGRKQASPPWVGVVGTGLRCCLTNGAGSRPALKKAVRGADNLVKRGYRGENFRTSPRTELAEGKGPHDPKKRVGKVGVIVGVKDEERFRTKG